jgi:bifunctional non-homologous end joining protein LigD
MPLEGRQAILADIIPVDTASIMRSRPLGSDGIALWPEIVAHGGEGLVAKRVGSFYLPGVRTSDWVRVKTEQARREERERFRR